MTNVFRTTRGGVVEERSLPILGLVIAGWTGRDRERVMEHVLELKALGVAPPSTTPLFYRVSASRLTTASAIEVVGENSSGEVEAVVIRSTGSLWVGVGSDHTDRTVEAYSVAVSKQLCDKLMGTELWAFDDVVPHWDSLVLRSWADGRLYQEGTTVALLDPRELMEKYAGGAFPDETAMFCGTLPAIGGVRPSARFAFEMHDPVLGRSLRHEYAIRVLPVVS